MLARLFRRRRLLTPEEYRDVVLRVLARGVVGESLSATEDPLVVSAGDSQFGLQNLYALYLTDRPSDRDRDAAIREHFARMIRDMASDPDLHSRPWLAVKGMLRPQLMPPEYSSDRIPLVALPFTDDVAIGIVLDTDQTYSYVRREDLATWSQTEATLLAAAIENLEAASAGIEVTFSEGEARYVAIEVKDAFDAVRILVPSIRAMAIAHLGSPCLAAIPNRDFLFFWAKSNSEQFHEFTRQKIQRDRDTQPYPLTSTIFAVTADKVAPWSDA